MISSARREDIVSALRRGTVPSSGLDALAVGIDTFAPTLDDELESVSAGRGGFKAVRGEYGTGKTFFGRWLQERARARGFAATEVQINETETPLHRLETVYRRLVEHLGTADTASGAFRGVIDGWFYALEQDVLADASVDASDAEGLLLRTNALMEARLGAISKTAPAFSAVLRTYRRALAAGDGMLADGLISWLAGQPNVAANIKRAAGIKGDLDHFGATNFLVGLLTILRDSGFSGLVMVLDEVETLRATAMVLLGDACLPLDRFNEAHGAYASAATLRSAPIIKKSAVLPEMNPVDVVDEALYGLCRDCRSMRPPA